MTGEMELGTASVSVAVAELRIAVAELGITVAKLGIAVAELGIATELRVLTVIATRSTPFIVLALRHERLLWWVER